MKSIIRGICFAALIAAAPNYVVPAEATAFAGVNEAFWLVRPYSGSLPDGVTLTCFGDAVTGGFNNTTCSEFASLKLMNDSAVEITETLSLVGGFSLTNNTNTDIILSAFSSADSSFNPGGSPIGASVDYPSAEFASFGSSVSGPGLLGGGDSHSCAVGIGTGLTGSTCGVQSPDDNSNLFFLGTLGAGQTITESYGIRIAVTALGIPEPPVSSLFVAGLVSMLFIGKALKKRQVEEF